MTKDQYLEYIKNSQNSKKKIQLEKGKRHKETFHKREYTDGKYTHGKMCNISHERNIN